MSALDTDLSELLRRTPSTRTDAFEAAAALHVLEARERVAAQMRRAGADVLEAPAASLPSACVGAYLRAKARARL